MKNIIDYPALAKKQSELFDTFQNQINENQLKVFEKQKKICEEALKHINNARVSNNKDVLKIEKSIWDNMLKATETYINNLKDLNKSC